MIEIRSTHPVAPADLIAIRALHETAERADGRASLGDAVWRDLEGGGRPTSAGVFAFEGGRLTGYAHVAPSDTFGARRWAAGFVVDPECRRAPMVTSLLDGVVRHTAANGGGEIVLWVFEPTDADDAVTAATGFVASRDLLQMRVALPLGQSPRWPDGILVRTFHPGTDDAAWLTVNNRAFRNHPEQGGWTEETLARRLAEPWFHADGFLLAWSTATAPPELAGFCWTKIHPSGSDRVGFGEIFVIGVDPDHRGTGLGRALVVAGLESLAGRGARTGMLYVDGANEPAAGLYAALGFTVHRRDRAYTRAVS